MTEIQMLSLYKSPEHSIDIVLDTDTYNELDDQFAIAYLLKYTDRLNVKGFTVAPFFIENWVKNITEGLQKSSDEITKLLKLSERKDLLNKIYIGSAQYLKDEHTPVESEAARFLIEESKFYTPEKPLYVVAIGAITNVASAILIDPTIVNRICIVWLGGSSLGWWINMEFNMYQDFAAVRTVMKSNVPFIHIPAQGVVSEFCTSQYELEHWLKGKNALADYLYENSLRVARQNARYKAWSRVI